MYFQIKIHSTKGNLKNIFLEGFLLSPFKLKNGINTILCKGYLSLDSSAFTFDVPLFFDSNSFDLIDLKACTKDKSRNKINNTYYLE